MDLNNICYTKFNCKCCGKSAIINIKPPWFISYYTLELHSSICFDCYYLFITQYNLKHNHIYNYKIYL